MEMEALLEAFGTICGSKGSRVPKAASPESDPIDVTVAVGVKRGNGMRPGEAKDVLTVNCGEVEKRPSGCRFIDPTNDGPGAIIPGAIIPAEVCAFVLGNRCEASDSDAVVFPASTLLLPPTFDSASDTTRCN